MPRRATPGIRPLAVHPDDRLLTWKEAAAKLGLHGESDETWNKYVAAYPELARARRFRRCPGERPTPMYLASAVSAFLATAFTDERPAGRNRAENFRGGARSREAAPAAPEVASA